MKKPTIPSCVCLFASAAIVFAAITPSSFQFRLAAETPSGGSEPMKQITHNRDHTYTNVLYVQKTVLIDGSALKSAKASTDALGQPIVDVTLTDAGAKQFAVVTQQNLHKRLAIIIDGQLIEAPTIQSPITGGKLQISGSFTKQEVKDLAKKLSGAPGNQ